MGKHANTVPEDYAKENLIYNPHTGYLFWKENISATVRAGSIAGRIEINKSSGKSYIRIRMKGKDVMAHRAAWFLYYGIEPKGTIDHINGNGIDNRICNLRDVSMRENTLNKRLSRNNTSGFNGVSYEKDRDKWIAQIIVNTRNIKIGRFSDKNDAIEARKKANIKYGFHENHGSIRSL